jgi:hypothetical protein
MAKDDVNVTILMKLFSQKHDDRNKKYVISDRETDIIFDVVQIPA